MKKIILTISLLVAGLSVAYAQHPAPAIGVTLGYGRTQQLGNNVYSALNHSAYQGGLTADVYFNDALSFHPEALYTMQYFDAENADLNRDISYINVPLLARYHVNGFFVEVGPEVNFALGAKNEAGDDVKSEVNSVIVDYVAGLGYQFGHGPALGVRYDGGFTNTFKDNTSTALGRGAFKSSTFWLNLSYSFGGK